MLLSPSVNPNMPHPRSSSGQSSGNDSNCRLCQMSWSEGMCARLKVLVSSRHSGPAFIAVSTSSMAEKAVPISAAEVSIPSFVIRFNDMRVEIELRNFRPSIIDFGICCRRAKITQPDVAAWRARVTYADRAHGPCFLSALALTRERFWPGALDCHFRMAVSSAASVVACFLSFVFIRVY